MGQEEMTSGCIREGLDWILGKVSSPKGLSSPVQASQESGQSPSLETFKRYMDVALRDMA